MDRATARITRLLDSDALMDISTRTTDEEINRSPSPVWSPMHEVPPSQNMNDENLQKAEMDSREPGVLNNGEETPKTEENPMLAFLGSEDLKTLSMMPPL